MSTDIAKTANDNEIIEYVPNTEMMQVRLENEMMMAECRARPRSIATMKAELAEMLAEFPAMADGAIYSKPCGKENGKQKFAEGLSIRCAELLAEVYGFNRVECSTTDIDADKVKIEATFTDYQKGRVWKDSGVLSKLYKSKDYGIQRTPDDRFYGVVCKAEASRRIREVILRSVNSALKAWFEAKCRELMDQTLDDAGIKLLVTSFAKIGVTEKQIESVIGRPRDMGWTQDDRRQLSGIWNAIKQNETTVAEAFGGTEAATGTNGNHATKSEAVLEKLKQSNGKTEAKLEAKSEPKTKAADRASSFTKCDEWLSIQPGVKLLVSDAATGSKVYSLPGGSELKLVDNAFGDNSVDTLDADALDQVRNTYAHAAKTRS